MSMVSKPRLLFHVTVLLPVLQLVLQFLICFLIIRLYNSTGDWDKNVAHLCKVQSRNHSYLVLIAEYISVLSKNYLINKKDVFESRKPSKTKFLVDTQGINQLSKSFFFIFHSCIVGISPLLQE